MSVGVHFDWGGVLEFRRRREQMRESEPISELPYEFSSIFYLMGEEKF